MELNIIKVSLLICTIFNIATEKGNKGAVIKEIFLDLNTEFNLSNCL